MCEKHYLREYRKRRAAGDGRDFRSKPRDGQWTAWSIGRHGYIVRSRGIGGGKREFQLEHRVIMSERMGRALLPEETVHHRNGIRHDNRIENLELWSGRHPKGARVEDQLVWAVETLRIYAPDLLA